MRLRRSSRPASVIFGKRSVVGLSSVGMFVLLTGCAANCFSGFAIAQDLTVDFARRRLRKLSHEGDMAREFVLAEALAREVPQLVDIRVVGPSIAHDERFGDLTARRIRYA